MKYFFAFFFIFIGLDAFSQTISGQILDSLSKIPVPYANVVLLNKNRGVSADENGKFEFDMQGEKDILLISSIGYEYKKIDIFRLENHHNIIIKLAQKPEELNELILNYKSKRYTGIKNLGLPKKAKVNTSLPFGNEICGYIKNPYYKRGLIKSVELDLQKENRADYIASYNIKFYEYDKTLNQPGKEIYNKNVIVNPENKTYKLKINVDTLNIKFPRDGICIGVEVINTKYSEKLKSMSYVGPAINFTHTNKEVLSWTRFRNKEWHVDTHKSRVRKDFINFLIRAEVIIEK